MSAPSLAPSRLHAIWPRLSLPHFALLSGPTPVRSLESVGPGVWLKDDSRCAELYGGNKVRKLEWSLAEIVAGKRTTVITAGGLGTNHGLATALFARELGIRTILLLVDQPVTQEVERNLDAMRASGATIVLAHTPRRAIALVPLISLRHMRSRAPSILGVGGSNAAGVLGFTEAAFELAAQVKSGELALPDEIVIPVGSGGSAAGLLLGLRLAGLSTRVHGVLVNDKTRITERSVKAMATRSQRLLQRHGVPTQDISLDGFVLDPSQLGEGYGIATPAGAQATERFAELGVALDPVYSAKAAAALLAKPGLHSGNVLFWHTFSAQPLDGNNNGH